MTTQIRSVAEAEAATRKELSKLRDEIERRDAFPVPSADVLHASLKCYKVAEQEAARVKTLEIECRESLRKAIRDYAQAHKDDCWTTDGDAKVIIPVDGEHLEVTASNISMQIKKVHVLPITRGIR